MTGLLRVLVIDDKPDLRVLAARALQKYSLRVDHQENAIAFEVEPNEHRLDCLSDRLRNQKPDIVILGESVSAQSFFGNFSQAVCGCSDFAVLAIRSDRQQAACFFSPNSCYFDYLTSPISEDELCFAVAKAAEGLIRQRSAQDSTSQTLSLLAIAAHELKAPAASIEGHLQIVLDQSAGENKEFYRHLLERCLVRSQAMRHLLNDLLDLQTIKSGKKKREILSVDLVESARNAIETLRSQARDKNVSVALHSPEKLTLQATRLEIDIIFNNLLSNAIKYNIENGKVDLTLEDRPQDVVIRVEDTGIGISQQDQSQLFREFTRIKTEKTQDISGTGLGLCIVKNIIELYQGTIDVRSTVNQGTTFTVRLPHV
jgi:two-component system sensor histidine kinase/response regulator